MVADNLLDRRSARRKTPMTRFVRNDIISLIGAAPRHDLAESVGPDLRLAELIHPDDDELGALRLGYATAAGDPKLRAAIAAQHGVAADDVVITVGGMHALFLSAYVLCGRGEEAIITTPVFPLARDALTSVGATVRPLPLRFEEDYRLDWRRLAALLSPATRLVSLASPQNPSGVGLPHAVLTGVLSAMAARCPDAFLLIDETYRHAVYDEDRAASSAALLGPQVIVTGSLSKCHGAPGLRIGWAITRNAALREQIMLGKFSTVIANSTVDEMFALRVLAQAEDIIDARRRHLSDTLARTAAWVEDNAGLVAWVRPDAGALCCVRLRPDVFDEAAVARFYAALGRLDARVGNGTWFGEEPRVFRLGFGLLPVWELEAALDALTAALQQARRSAA
ncbi:pyridoxal phosphate-dependent aminotransferase [Bradyrhizobium sp. LHD-71]|uniref:pyridoxal phosphate-dependent aminotransferase n=1 Tax=Bradyrhizobium sp. LHD-71 TaxID=3072141 RepID=UPI00280F1894|nr:pyridoxal phosphate-dependent aminotransferase [Bradyrhizobium sp. LHD-71]MDQ8729802.1 pyridoxal phosphate-dependent aminotransferase [Bradyrhizobium sp. LHD-71]